MLPLIRRGVRIGFARERTPPAPARRKWPERLGRRPRLHERILVLLPRSARTTRSPSARCGARSSSASRTSTRRTLYGRGHNETLVGRALRDRPPEVLIASKCGLENRGFPRRKTVRDGRPETVRRHCDASLARLGIEYLDLYYLHRVDPKVPVEETLRRARGSSWPRARSAGSASPSARSTSSRARTPRIR